MPAMTGGGQFPFEGSFLFAGELEDEGAGAGAVIEVHEHDLLPGAESHSAVHERNGERGPQE